VRCRASLRSINSLPLAILLLLPVTLHTRARHETSDDGTLCLVSTASVLMFVVVGLLLLLLLWRLLWHRDRGSRRSQIYDLFDHVERSESLARLHVIHGGLDLGEQQLLANELGDARAIQHISQRLGPLDEAEQDASPAGGLPATMSATECIHH